MILFLVINILNVHGIAPESDIFDGRGLSYKSFQEVYNLEKASLERASDTAIQIEGECGLDEDCQSRIQETVIQLEQIEASYKESPQEELKVPSSFNFFLITQNLLKECQSVEYHLLTQICMTLFQIYECGEMYVAGDYVNLTYQVLLITTFQLLPLIPNIPMRLVNAIICVNRILMKPVPYVLAHIVQLAIRLLFVCVQSRFLKGYEIYIRSLLYVLTYLYFGENYNPRFLYEDQVEFMSEEELSCELPKEVMIDNNLDFQSRDSFCRPIRLNCTNEKWSLPQKKSPPCVKSIIKEMVREDAVACFINGGKVLKKMDQFMKGEKLNVSVHEKNQTGYQVWHHYGAYVKHLAPLCDVYESNEVNETLRVSAVTPVIKYAVKDMLKLYTKKGRWRNSSQGDFNDLLLYQRSIVALHDFARNNLCHGDAHTENIRTINGKDMFLIDLDMARRGACLKRDYMDITEFYPIFHEGIHPETKDLFVELNQIDSLMSLEKTMEKKDIWPDFVFDDGRVMYTLRQFPDLLRKLTSDVERVLKAFPPIYYERFVQMIRENIDFQTPYPSKIEDLFYKEPTFKKIVVVQTKESFLNRLFLFKQRVIGDVKLEKYLTLASVVRTDFSKKKRSTIERRSVRKRVPNFLSNVRCCVPNYSKRVLKCA